ncbi:hypothetical protein GCM10010507_35440 [Streptomyces cinnamoneus]|uniref:Uncharacterized protein n=1 Tax=Streptomyces cinnamoneus TaxID=53446 RepID=A0A918WKK6_STRCJ|nr:hypothetical protein GCM10010507_35440 [Streptomyces cinnamoneus]
MKPRNPLTFLSSGRPLGPVVGPESSSSPDEEHPATKRTATAITAAVLLIAFTG